MNPKKNGALNTVMVLFALTAIIIGQIGVMIYFGFEKSGFDIDELWTYGLSNSIDQPFIESRLGEWTDGARFGNYLKVLWGHEYLNVYENQIADVHPPLYYLFVHAVCSVVRHITDFTKWTAIGLNLACFVVTQLALFVLTSRLLTRGRGKLFGCAEMSALGPVAVYGFGAGAISSVIFIRMYAMMTMWAVFLALVLVLLYQEGHKPWLMLLFKTVLVLGFLTQYYFIIFACMFCGAYFFAKLVLHQWKEAAELVFSCLLALVIAVGFFPWCIEHIFSGYRGRGAIEQAAALNWKGLTEAASKMVGILNRQQFSGMLFVLLGAAFLLCLVFFIGKRIYDHVQCTASLIALTASMLYLTVIAVIAPFKVDRYIFCIYPIVVAAIWLLFVSLGKDRAIQKTIALLITVVLISTDAFAVVRGDQVNYLFKERSDNIEISRAYASYPCVVLGDTELTQLLLELNEYDQVLVLGENSADQIVSAVRQLTGDITPGFVLYRRYINKEELQQIVEEAGASEAKVLYWNLYGVYLIE